MFQSPSFQAMLNNSYHNTKPTTSAKDAFDGLIQDFCVRFGPKKHERMNQLNVYTEQFLADVWEDILMWKRNTPDRGSEEFGILITLFMRRHYWELRGWLRGYTNVRLWSVIGDLLWAKRWEFAAINSELRAAIILEYQARNIPNWGRDGESLSATSIIPSSSEPDLPALENNSAEKENLRVRPVEDDVDLDFEDDAGDPMQED